MADLWRAQVDVGTITHTAHDPYGVASVPRPPAYIFAAWDMASGYVPAIRIRRDYAVNLITFADEWLMIEEHGFASRLDPFPEGTFSFFKTAAIHATFFSPNATNGVAFLTGGTLMIDKDETLGQFTYTGLLGNSTKTFVDLGGAIDGEMIPYRLYAQSGSLATFGHAFTDETTLSVPFTNFYGKKNTVTFIGASLASGDRGTWAGGTVGYVPWIVQVGAQANLTNPDTPTQIVAGIHANDIDDPAAFAFEYRQWDETPMPMEGPDLIHAAEHGAHWAAVSLMAGLDTLAWRRTHDKGDSWTIGTIYMDAAATNTSPSITWKMGRLNVVWQNGTDILQAFSLDLGATWSTPVTLSITGTNPRHLVDPATGFSWYFYADGGDIKVKRSGDFGASFIGAAVTVATVAAQTVAAQMALDGSLLVGYISAGTWMQKRSTDLGLTWS